ncbi:hypothetical protein RE9425_05220 [Prescottella equi]|nr:hypothetical protein RE9425_05220 [Prescottella equi]
MECVFCGAGSKVRTTRSNPGNAEVIRARVCEKNPKHRWTTTEAAHGPRLDGALFVLRTGDRRPALPWSEDKLRVDLNESSLGELSPTEVEAIVSQVVVGLTRKLRGPRGQSIEELVEVSQFRHRPDIVRAIRDTHIRDEVEQALRDRGHDMIRVLYALAVRGRVLLSRKHKEIEGSGWHSAEHVLQWLHLDHNYPHLQPEKPLARPPVHHEEWTPEQNGADPAFVRKQPRSGGQTAETFDIDQFVASIQKAMLGRPNAHYHARYVSWLVLRQVTGQKTVTSSQLGVDVLDCLRRLDDIAYLRWATVMKGIDTVEGFHAEAMALIQHPSPKLSFDRRISKPVETRLKTQ